MKPAVSLSLSRAADSGHRSRSDENLAPGRASLLVVHSDPGEWRIDEQPEDWDSVGHPSTGLIQEILRHDLKVVVGSVGEAAPAIDFTNGVNARHRRLELVVDFDESLGVEFDVGRLDAEVVSVGHPPHGQQHV